MPARSASADREAEFERHVEARHPAIDLDAAQVVERIPTLPKKADDAIEASLRCREFKGSSRCQSKAAETGNRGEEQGLVRLVVGDVQEDLEARQIRNVGAGCRRSVVAGASSSQPVRPARGRACRSGR